MKKKIDHYFPKPQGLYDPRWEKDACGVGFVCHIKGQRSHEIVEQGLTILKRLAHRGATGADPKTGDGAGVLIQIPHEYFSKVCERENIPLPPAGEYGTGLIFLPTAKREQAFCRQVLEKTAAKLGLRVLGWRHIAVDDSSIGRIARASQPVIEQIFFGQDGIRPIEDKDILALERKLFVLRKLVENQVRASQLRQGRSFYITNLSCRTFSYKGLLMPEQVDQYYPELLDRDIKSAICLVHSRYSTNTFPTWDLAQPFRFLAHNGEINTLRGNINWMRAREALLKSDLIGPELKKILPVIVPGGSDSAALDNVLELLVLSGRSLAQSLLMLIPAAFEQDKLMPQKLRDFYHYHMCFMEPWDGPAAVAVTDGTRVGAILDRNGLRPARYLVTKNGLAVMASEVGVLDIPPEDIIQSGRLEPGKIFFINTERGRIISDREIKEELAGRQPYGQWIKDNLVPLEELPTGPAVKETSPKKPAKAEDIYTRLKAFGYSREDLKIILKPMAETGKEPLGSMGNDTPPAVLSQRPQLLYDYFKQLFAQVTNPPIDPIREELVMSLTCYLGKQKNTLAELPEHCHKIEIKSPFLTNEELAKIKAADSGGFRTKTLSLLYEAASGKNYRQLLQELCWQADQGIKDGYTFFVLSDRGVDKDHPALPALLAVGTVHQYLVRTGRRTQIGLFLESGEPREVQHFAVLFAFGLGCVNPYLAYEAIDQLIKEKELALDPETAKGNYRQALTQGLLKILSKMGISTLRSYRSAQIFEILGLADEVVDLCFTGATSRIGGADLRVLARETLLRHRQAYPANTSADNILPTGGVYQWKRDGESHLWNPESIAALQDAARNDDYGRFLEFAKLIDDQSQNPTTLRGLLKFKKQKPIPIDQVEPVDSIVKRFATGAMSFGSISRGAHEAMALALNALGGRSNTGEGGEDPERFKALPDGSSKRSAIKQVASGRFGVTANYLANADEIQIKIAQGAKPGEGGQLPGHKVSVTIAKVRYTTPGVTLISPPPHHDIYSIEDLAQLIFDLKNVNPRARISVKLVSEIGVGTVAAGVAKGHADMILIAGGDGGTGASPLSSIRYAGLPWELGLSETHQTLVLNDLRSRVRLQTDGQLRTGRDVAMAALLGAEEFGFATAPLVVLGCVMLRHCHLNNCALGVATQDEELQARFRGRPENLVYYFRFVARQLREIMAGLGLRSLEEMIGRTDLLSVNEDILPWKAGKLDLSKILYRPKVSAEVGTHCLRGQDHAIDDVLDRLLIDLAEPALSRRQPVVKELGIKNHNRSTGAMLSGEIAKHYGDPGLPEDTIHFKFSGVAGQSFGAWLAHGVTLELEGLANDYVGKGISGGRIIVYPDKNAGFKAEENIVIGNTTFYGAISGEAFIRGRAGERFCIRNSGLNAVVEGVGDHGCEYMTGGRVVILGPTGRNFAAGMSGGIAYVHDPDGTFAKKCNLSMVSLEALAPDNEETLRKLLAEHQRCTGSPLAAMILKDFETARSRFVKVIPKEYKRVLAGKPAVKKVDLLEVADG